MTSTTAGSSLGQTIYAALSGLKVNQAGVQNAANNIANANVEGYSRKIFTQISQVVGTSGAGVDAGALGRAVDENLLRTMRDQLSQTNYQSIKQDFFELTQQFFGAPGDGFSFANTLSDLSAAIDFSAINPEQLTNRVKVIDTANRFARDVSTLGQNIQKLRFNADQQIKQSVTAINNHINTIDDLNSKIGYNTLAGLPTNDLADERDRQINELSKIMKVQMFFTDNNQVLIYSSSGVGLLQGTVIPLDYNNVGTIMTPQLSYPGNGVQPILSNNVDVTNRLAGGQLEALLELRDNILPGLQSQLDLLTLSVRDQVNQVHNLGSSFPPSTTLTSSRTFTATTDPLTGSGTLRIATVNNKGQFAQLPIDLDLSTVITVGDFITQINSGLGYTAASLNADGKLVLTGNGSNGIAMAAMTPTATFQDSGKSFSASHFFGFNDFFVTPNINLVPTSISGAAQNLSVRSDLVSDPSKISFAQLNTTTTPSLYPAGFADDQMAISKGDNAIAIQLGEAFKSSDITFAGIGGMPAMTTSMINYAGTIISLNATYASSAKSEFTYNNAILETVTNSAASYSGVNMDEELTSLVVFQNAYSASARVLSVVNEMMDALNRLV